MTSFEMLVKLKELKDALSYVYIGDNGDALRAFVSKEEAVKGGFNEDTIYKVFVETAEYVALTQEVKKSKVVVTKNIFTDVVPVQYEEEEEFQEQEDDEYDDYDEVPLPLKTGPTNETAQSIQDKLKMLSALKMVKPAGMNNDDREYCYDCGEPTREIDSGFKKYRICSVCNK